MARNRIKPNMEGLTSCPVNFLRSREINSSQARWNPTVATSRFLSQKLEDSPNLYQKNLYAHYGCVNALEFSNDGNLLVSGGDDRGVLLWDVHASFAGKYKPRLMKAEHNSNIFSLAFDSFNKKIFSAGNDGKVIVHDLVTGETLNLFLHELAVYGVSVHPTIDTIFTSAGEDGQVLMYDTRAPASAEPLCIAKCHDAYHAVQFHPIEPLFVVTANSKNGVALWDVRKPTVPVIRYGDKKWSHSSMSARFNTNGTQIVALRRRLPPVLYDTQSPKPICQFDAKHYYNSCTMKSCCFAGDKDQFVLSGSDDFNLYMWKIPSRKSKVNFVSSPHTVLHGHRSIVNQVRFNPKNFVIASSGVEKVVKLWSGYILPGSSNNLTTMTRKVFSHEEYIGLVVQNGQSVNQDYSNGNTEEDPRMMAFFDSLVQREVEGCTTNSESSDDDDFDISTVMDSTLTPSSSSVANTSQSDDDLPVDSSSRQRMALWSALRGNSAFSLLNKEIESSDEEEEDEDLVRKMRRHSDGRTLILKLISKKRAKLKAAKRKRKHQRRLRKKQSRYLYQPDESRSKRVESDPYLLPVLGDSGGASSSSNGNFRRRGVAPYTIMLFQDSNENESDNDTNRSNVVSKKLSKKRTYSELNRNSNWSSVSSSSSDDESNLNIKNFKRKRNYILDSDSEQSDSLGQSNANGHIISVISDIIDTDEGENDDNKVANSNRSSSHELIDQRQSTSNCEFDAFIANNSGQKSEFDGSATNSESRAQNLINNDNLNSSDIIVPISGITTDNDGAVLFDLDHSPLSSGFSLHPSVDIYLSPTNTKLNESNNNDSVCELKDKSNVNSDDDVNSTPDSGISSTPDRGIPPTPSSTEKSEEENNGSCNLSKNNSSKLSIFFKKRMTKCATKNYRLRNKDEET